MREASIIVVGSEKPGADEAYEALFDAIIREFGGYTGHEAYGQWRDDEGVVHTDMGDRLVIAMADTYENEFKLLRIAADLRRGLGEQSVYVRLASGNVVFVDGTTDAALSVATSAA